MNDPIKTARRRFLFSIACSSMAVIVTGVWALRTIDSQVISDPSLVGAPNPNERQMELNHDEGGGDDEFSADAFAITLWHTPPLPPPPPGTQDEEKLARSEMPQPALAPLRVQLVAIIEQNGVHRAALYDQVDDRIVIVMNGDRIRQRVVQVTADAIQFIADGSGESEQLFLRPDQTQQRRFQIINSEGESS